ncbi:DUF1028 domain-containing protein [Chryseolinea lacunae]|uniref:DUF1028 domain-containing protein n=1 Tax=Chryseolinea lacunae TaxID=2801331 RepID=A0ABS1KQ81_9BACT|nr:DUF1028 domain-containing protein [Chryseolinea lacunae]MBL0741372.1 DUF1028 domain-containing protein [Chryseolinea lacunae]
MNVTKTLFLVLLLATQGFSSFATWSIIVANPKTKEIGIAGASCTQSVYGIGAIMPGKGAIVVQANANGYAKLRGFEMIMSGTAPATILETLKQPQFDPENQQYAILSLTDVDHPVTYTGTKTISYAGSLTGHGISVQGNMLTSADVLKAVFDAAVKAQKDSLAIEDILMIALEAGAKFGGDKRCGERKASSSFLTVSQPEDVDKHWLNLVIYGNDDRTRAVEALRQKFDEWKSSEKPNRKTP